MLGEITNQAYNEQRDARTKRFNILRQKRKFSETNPTPTKPKQLNIQPSILLSAASESSENHYIIESHSKCISWNIKFQFVVITCLKFFYMCTLVSLQLLLRILVIRLRRGYKGIKNAYMKVSNLLLKPQLNQHLPSSKTIVVALQVLVSVLLIRHNPH